MADADAGHAGFEQVRGVDGAAPCRFFVENNRGDDADAEAQRDVVVS